MRPTVFGGGLDPQTRCVHYNTQLDVIAIAMKCCGTYYACKDYHNALAGHALQTWPRAEGIGQRCCAAFAGRR